MLVHLHVKNLAIIDEIEIDFAKHLNILTGETGAGKSVIIGSINIALGGKVPADLIRKGAEYGLVELVFQTDDKKVQKKLIELDLPFEEGQIILSRKLMKGRSVCKINGEIVPVSAVKELSSYLIDIHGQHEHQSLLYKSKHLEILDHYCKKDTEMIKENISRLYTQYKAVSEELAEWNVSLEERAREISFLEYEINEIEAARLREGEEEELDRQFKKLSNANLIMEGLASVCQLTSSCQDAAAYQIGRAVRCIERLGNVDDKIKEFSEQLGNIENLLSDFNVDLNDYLNEVHYDEEAMRQMEERLALIHHLKVKYGNSIGKVIQYCQQIKEKLEKYLKFEEYRKELQDKLAETEHQLQLNCENLSRVRKRYAEKLSNNIYHALTDLNFLDVQFDIVFKKMKHYTVNGIDDIEFYISTNPGEDKKPLGKVASGGELSRIMLAIKSVMAEHDLTDALVFDEIDVGVSGRTAQKVSEKLSSISKKRQVICITHLPQIAAMADVHFVIEKELKGINTVTSIRKLALKDSVKELARILGGAVITETVIQSAKEMKELAAKTKNY